MQTVSSLDISENKGVVCEGSFLNLSATCIIVLKEFCFFFFILFFLIYNMLSSILGIWRYLIFLTSLSLGQLMEKDGTESCM